MKSMTAQAKLGIALLAFVFALAIFGTAFVYAQVMRVKDSDPAPSSTPTATSQAPPKATY